ncbi:UNVERIFIED_CONTAM: hypothetical protein Sindi_2591000 [Sesamum indicum]
MLIMDPVLTVNNAYSMVLRVEKQREVNMEGTDTMDNAITQVRTGGKNDYLARLGQWRVLKQFSSSIRTV